MINIKAIKTANAKTVRAYKAAYDALEALNLSEEAITAIHATLAIEQAMRREDDLKEGLKKEGGNI